MYIIKKLKTKHNDSIYKAILDRIMVPRYSSRIADVCYYIDKKVIHPKRTNWRIFIISNGLDIKLKSLEQWSTFFWNEKDKYCFYFIKPDMKEENREIIFDVWEKFKKETENEVVIVNDINDAIRGEEYIYSRFTYVLSEKGMLSEEEVSKLHKNLDNIVGKFYEIQYKEKFDLDPKYISIRYSPSSHCLKDA